jgi:hypothetical protein
MGSNLQNLLKFLWESKNVDEGAIEPKQMAEEKLALFVPSPDQLSSILLYSPALLLESIRKAKNSDTQGKAIVGAIALHDNEHCGSWEVDLSGAEKGYGPFLYQAASATLGWIISDRGDVSPQAENVWKWMFNHPEQWEKQSLIGLENDEQDCWHLDYSQSDLGDEAKNHFLNFKYQWKGSSSIASGLTAAHKKSVSQISKLTRLSEEEVELFLQEEGETYLYQ